MSDSTQPSSATLLIVTRAIRRLQDLGESNTSIMGVLLTAQLMSVRGVEFAQTLHDKADRLGRSGALSVGATAKIAADLFEQLSAQPLSAEDFGRVKEGLVTNDEFFAMVTRMQGVLGGASRLFN